MARKPRTDYPGAWHHVMDRGLAKRAVFETKGQRRFFLALVAREVRAGRLELHAFCLMENHFHLLVRSPIGQLSQALQHIKGRFVRRFNRDNGRDGPLFRGRFRSELVEDPLYLRTLVRYIDHNPVVAGLVDDPIQYVYSSASHWCSERPALWLSRDWIPSELAFWMTEACPIPIAYREMFGAPPSPDESDEVRHVARGPRPARRSWSEERAILADGQSEVPRHVDPGRALALLDTLDSALLDVPLSKGTRSVRTRDILTTMLLRDGCSSSFREIAQATRVSVPTASRRYRMHKNEVTRNRAYAELTHSLLARIADFLRLE